MPSRRTTHRTASGRKVYAVRKSTGEFADIQSYKRAHGQDVKRRSAAERKSSPSKRADVSVRRSSR